MNGDIIYAISSYAKWLLKSQMLKSLVNFGKNEYSTRGALGRFDSEVIRVTIPRHCINYGIKQICIIRFVHIGQYLIMFRFILNFLFLLEIANGTDLLWDLSKSHIFGVGFLKHIRYHSAYFTVTLLWLEPHSDKLEKKKYHRDSICEIEI